ncbi:NAD-dependent epimerase/dehydratase family protein [Haloarculaceae archaeon H-GB2-1]|nr:NAD-dependent epimerase/dehydratase family protein [Haloarculaceae archaeon H-GB1-1]MEA5389571.1 NAD-dependent epimerase/dehydratase family protein [Haloarculaceae archaeon H-GB11]MEA5409976.1 NAD-dependent epimerase/dehydratase family protein [Haloarculaceae archaeon H-GB2-1]
MTVLVTGATGFLGSSLCRALARRGWDVRALRRDSSDVSALSDVDLEWVVGDVLDEASLRDAMDGCDAVFHLAGIGLTAGPPETVRRVNVTGTKNALSAAEAADVDRFVFTSTAGTRRSDGVADETDTAPPIGAYQESKARAEALVDHRAANGLDAVTVHPTSVFGPGDQEFTGRLLSLVTDPKMVAYLPGGVSFVSVDDVVRGIIAAHEDGETGEHYILGGENLTFERALAILASRADGSRPRVEVPPEAVKLLGYVAGAADQLLDARFFPFDPDMAELSTQTLFYTSEKAQSELGYDSQPLDAHADAAIEWYEES